MTRICPHCNAKLGGYERFFCTACGELLPSELTVRDDNQARVAHFGTSEKEQKPVLSPANNESPKINFSGLIFAILAISAVVGFVYFAKSRLADLLVSGNKTAESSESADSAHTTYYKNVIESPLMWETNTFGIDQSIQMVPATAEIVIEGNDLAKFAAAYAQVDPTYKNLVTALQGKVEQHFVFFAKKIGEDYLWSLIVYPLNPELIVNVDAPWLKVWKNAPIILITTQDSIVAEVASVKNNAAKSFATTPIYLAAKNDSPRNGKLFIYAANQNAKNYFYSLSATPKLPAEIKTLIDTIRTSNSDYTIVL